MNTELEKKKRRCLLFPVSPSRASYSSFFLEYMEMPPPKKLLEAARRIM